MTTFEKYLENLLTLSFSWNADDLDDLDRSGKIDFMTFQNFLGLSLFSSSIFRWYVDLAFLTAL